jgi:hypothetical protein
MCAAVAALLLRCRCACAVAACVASAAPAAVAVRALLQARVATAAHLLLLSRLLLPLQSLLLMSETAAAFY